MENMNNIFEAIRKDAEGGKAAEVRRLGLWCGSHLEDIQEEMNSSVCPTMAFNESGEDLYNLLLERGWTPPPLK